LSQDRKILTKTFTENTSKEGEEIVIKDIAGNEIKKVIKIQNIDKTAPELNVQYSDPDQDGRVTVQIIGNEKLQKRNVSGWTISKDEKIISKTFNKNVYGTIQVSDLAGNKTNVTINITNAGKTEKIDLNPKVEYNKEKTNKPVEVKITVDKKVKEIEGWNQELNGDKYVLKKNYNQNTNEEIILIDDENEENKESIIIDIDNIDIDKPIVQIDYSAVDKQTNAVIVKIKANEPIQEIGEGWTLSNRTTLTKVFDENTSEEGEKVIIKDLVGNETEVIVKVNSIGVEEPEDSNILNENITFSTKEYTDGEVKVTITVNTAINIENGKDGWVLSNDGKRLEKIYKANETETITIVDKNDEDNKKDIIVIVDNIIVLGDLDNDNKITIIDLLLVKRHIILSDKDQWSQNEKIFKQADINKDGTINIMDLLLLKKILLKA
jgi:hypothetical protein